MTMKEWLTAREIAAERLSNELPMTESGMIRFISDNGWNNSFVYCRKRSGRGGGLEYHINLLPALARIEYERRYRAIERVEPKPAPDLVLGDNLTERAARGRDARIAVLAAFESFSKGRREAVETLLFMFANQYNMGSLKVDPWVRDLIPTVSKRTMHRWRSAKFVGRVDRLAVDRGAARKGKGVLDVAEGGKVRAHLLALIAHNPHLSAKHLLKLLRDEFGDVISAKGKSVNLKTFSVRTLQLFVSRLKVEEEVALTKLSNPDQYRSHMAPAGVGTYRWLEGKPGELWMIDASPVDALCTDGRHSIYAAIDIGTRRTILYVSRTPRASAVALLIRKGIMAWGVPRQIKTDNGSDFVAQATVRLFDSLDIEPLTSHAYSPAEKGHVERVIKTFQHDCATLLPGFVGHNVTDRKAIEDRKSFAQRLGEDTAETFAVSMTGAELQTYCDEWINLIYSHAEHAGLKGKTPVQVAQQSTAPIRSVDPTALDVLLMPIAGQHGIRTVTKLGVRVDHHHYVVNACLPGDRVLVRQDPNDVGRVLCFDAETGVYRGEGICPELRGIAASTVLQAKREAQKEILDEKTSEAKRRIRELTKGAPLIERVLNVARRDAPNVIALPKRTEEHTTPAIEAAKQVSAPIASKELTGRAAEILAEAKAAEPIAVKRPANVTPLRTQETRHQRYARALDIERAMAAGQEIPTDQAVWYGGYSAGPEYRAMRKTYGEQVSS